MRRAAIACLIAGLTLPASAAHAAPSHWLASVRTTMTASVERSESCDEPSHANYELTTTTTQPIPVRKQSPAPGFPQYVYASFSPKTRVVTSADEKISMCDTGESCGSGGTVTRSARPRYFAQTIRGARLKVDVGSDTPEPFFIPKSPCARLLPSRDGLLPHRFQDRVVKRVPYGRFSRARFSIRLSARGYPVSIGDTNGGRLRGTGSFSMVVRFRPG